jgi:myo-inositol-1(or 4)-monophosphatase
LRALPHCPTAPLDDQPPPLRSRSLPLPPLCRRSRRRGRRCRPDPARDLLSGSEDLELAERAAREAGALLLERFREPARGIGRKSSETDLVSDADRAAEELIAGLLERERPDDALLAEEGARGEGPSGRRWVIDPLDGTVNFLYGQAHWCVSIALEDAAGGLVGVVHDPAKGETFTAIRGAGARLGSSPISVRRHERLETALIATGFGYDAARRSVQAQALLRVLPGVRDIRRAGSAALDLAWLAAGRLDGYFERGVQHWDWAAGRLLVTEAGGLVADLDGEPAGLAAAAPELLPALRELVSAG